MEKEQNIPGTASARDFPITEMIKKIHRTVRPIEIFCTISGYFILLYKLTTMKKGMRDSNVGFSRVL